MADHTSSSSLMNEQLPCIRDKRNSRVRRERCPHMLRHIHPYSWNSYHGQTSANGVQNLVVVVCYLVCKYRRPSKRLVVVSLAAQFEKHSVRGEVRRIHPASMAPVTEAPLKLRSRIQESLDGVQCVDLVECPTSGQLFVDKHTYMTSRSPDGRNANAAALNELDLHLSLRDVEHVVKLERHSLQRERLHLLYEHCVRGDLLDIMQQELRLLTAGVSPQSSSILTCTDAGRRNVFTAVLRGVQALHNAGIAHMDLSLENIFVTESKIVKVGDLGHAQRFKHDRPNVQVIQVAKEAYAAPELFARTEVEDVRLVDVWSLGIILWTLCTKRALIRRPSTDSDKLFTRMVEYGTAFALKETGVLSQVPATCVDLLVGLLQVNPKSRLSVAAALQHPWVTQEAAKTSSRSQSRRKSIGNLIMKKGEELMKKHQCPEKMTRGRTTSAEIALESTRVTLTSRNVA